MSYDIGKSHGEETDYSNVKAAGKPSQQRTDNNNVLDHFKIQDEVDATVHNASSATALEKQTTSFPYAQDITTIQTHTDYNNKTFRQEGMETQICGHETNMLTDPELDDCLLSKEPGYQTDRHYSRPAYDPNIVFGTTVTPNVRPNKKGTYTEYLSDEITKESFDNPTERLALCKSNTRRELYLQCFDYLNTLRKCFSTHFDEAFFRLFYLHLKYLDTARTGWLPKQVVYDFCVAKYVKFNPSLVEPLLKDWNAFDGSQIKYKVFVHVLNYREASPGLPIIPDISPDCLEFSTTYNDMVKTGQKVDMKLMAGLPSSDLDKNYYASAIDFHRKHNVRLSKESYAKSCVPMSSSHLLLQGISKQELYTQRSPEHVREVIEAAGIIFTDDKFNEIWNEAKLFHSQGMVSYETFKRAFCKIYKE